MGESRRGNHEGAVHGMADGRIGRREGHFVEGWIGDFAGSHHRIHGQSTYQPNNVLHPNTTLYTSIKRTPLPPTQYLVLVEPAGRVQDLRLEAVAVDAEG